MTLKLLLWAAGVSLLIVACTDQQRSPDRGVPASTPTIPTAGPRGSSGPGPDPYVLVDGRKYEPKAGRIRADLLNVDELMPLTVEARPNSEGMWRATPTVYALGGVPVEEAFLLRFPANAAGVSIGGSNYPSCETSYVTVFTADGADVSPPPFSPRPREPDPDGRLPTPVPTPTTRPLFRLSTEGLVGAGWPTILWDAAVLEYQGVTYRETGSGYLDFGTADTSIPTRLLSQVETLTISYDIHPVVPENLRPILNGSTAIDHVVVYRPSDRAASEVVVVDPCPKDYRPDEFVYYEAVREPVGSSGQSSSDSGAAPATKPDSRIVVVTKPQSPPSSMLELVSGMEIIGIGTVGSQVKQTMENSAVPFDTLGTPVSPHPTPYLYYVVTFEQVFRDDGTVAGGKPVLIRFAGSISAKNIRTTDGGYVHVQPGVRGLFFLSEFQGSYQIARSGYGLLDIGGDQVRYTADGQSRVVGFTTNTAPDAFVSELKETIVQDGSGR